MGGGRGYRGLNVQRGHPSASPGQTTPVLTEIMVYNRR